MLIKKPLETTALFSLKFTKPIPPPTHIPILVVVLLIIMASLKPSSRYAFLDSSRSSSSSVFSDSSSSTDAQRNTNSRALRIDSPATGSSGADSQRQTALFLRGKKQQNLGAMVKKLVETQSRAKSGSEAVPPEDVVSTDFKKPERKGAKFTALHRKLFVKAPGLPKVGDSSEKKALSDGKGSTRTLGMVLRSERELVDKNVEYEAKIAELNLMVEAKNNEVEKLKDLCLKQRAEIKGLKSAVLFPEDMNVQLQQLLEKQGLELKQANQIIPSLQQQVAFLTGHLQCLAQDLAEVKAAKNSMQDSTSGQVNSPKTPAYEYEAANSVEFSSGVTTSPGSSDDMFLSDFNPCLTPYTVKSKVKELEKMKHEAFHDPRLSKNNFAKHRNVSLVFCDNISNSPEYYHSNQGRTPQVPNRLKETE